MSHTSKKAGGRMWHEARKQEKKIRGMLVDYRRRAERRRDYYERIKSDPTQFLQLHGRPCRVHLDPVIAAAGDSPANMMPWQENPDNLIDRFDVRAHLDWIPEVNNENDIDISLTNEDRQMNYERYRIIVQNEFLGVPEEKFLHQIYLEEQFGCSSRPETLRDKKKSCSTAAIGYNYESNATASDPSKSPDVVIPPTEEEDEDSDIDLDMCVNVSQIEPSQAHEMNQVAQKYGLIGADYFSFLTQDFEEAETLRQARKQEEEKAMYSGRRSRRERRAFREKNMVGRVMSPPSYAARESPEYKVHDRSSSKSLSRSISPVNSGQITFITSFGSDEDTIRDDAIICQTPSRTRSSHSSNTSSKSLSPRSSRAHARRRVSGKSRSRSSSCCRNRFLRRHDARESSVLLPRSSRNTSELGGYRGSESRDLSHRSKFHMKRSASGGRSHSNSKIKPNPRLRLRSRSRAHLRTAHVLRPSSSISSSDTDSKVSDCLSKRPACKMQSSPHSQSKSPERRYKCAAVSRSSSESKSRSSSNSLTYTNPTISSGTKTETRSRSLSRPSRSISRSRRSKSSDDKAIVPRYYGRRGRSSSSEIELSDGDDQDPQSRSRASVSTQNMNKPMTGFSTYPGAGHKDSKITPQERLKKKMQTLLNRQYKADKKAERARVEKLEQQRQDREDEIREMSLKLRRRQRERRHRYEERDSESDSSSCHSPSPKRDPRDLKSKSRQNSLLEIDASDCYRDEERISDKDTATKEITRREGSSRRNRNDDFSLMNKR